MKMLTLEEAAIFLKMTPEGLRRKAANGQVPGAKPGKRWCFSQDDLAEYVRSFYPSKAKAMQGVSKDSDWRYKWHSTSEKICGGLRSATSESEYNTALERPAK